MSIKIIFFDIDDTLCRLGNLPDNNYQLLKTLKASTDVRLAIATGRSVAMLPSDIRHLFDEDIFDALVSANGQYNVVNGELISHYPITTTQAASLVAVCNRHNIAYQQLSEHHIAWSEKLPSFEMVLGRFPNCVIEPDYYRRHTIYQFSIFLPEMQENPSLVKEFEALGFHLARWHQGGADILPKDGSKARGITDVCSKLGIDIKDTMAFGDGLNDLEMLQHVGIGIAMRDGWPQLKAVADDVTGTIEEDGLRLALVKYGIL